MGSGLPDIVPRDSIVRRDDAVTIQQVMGPFFLGIVISYLLWGIQITQSYYYYKSYRRTDKMWLKAAVGLLFTIDALQSICASHSTWGLLVDGWGDPQIFAEPLGWGVYLVPFTDTLTTSIVHFFYAQKIWTLLNPPYSYLWTAVVITFSLLQLTAGIGCTSFMFSIQISLIEFTRIKNWVFIWLIPASVTDLIITGVMTWKLSTSRTGFKRTDDIISKLVRLTVETGLATSVVQIADIVVYLIWPVKPYHAILTFMAPKVYSNSMLALLNSRQPRTWDAIDKQTGDSIQIHTSQTIAITNDYELGKNSRARNEERTAPQPESIEISFIRKSGS